MHASVFMRVGVHVCVFACVYEMCVRVCIHLRVCVGLYACACVCFWSNRCCKASSNQINMLIAYSLALSVYRSDLSIYPSIFLSSIFYFCMYLTKYLSVIYLSIFIRPSVYLCNYLYMYICKT